MEICKEQTKGKKINIFVDYWKDFTYVVGKLSICCLIATHAPRDIAQFVLCKKFIQGKYMTKTSQSSYQDVSIPGNYFEYNWLCNC